MKSKKPKKKAVSAKPQRTLQKSLKKKAATPYVCYTLKEIFDKRVENNYGIAAVDALTDAFKNKKRLAIVDRNIDPKKIPQVWYSLSDYIEIDGIVLKSTGLYNVQ
jgi:hypothetical protein